MIAHKFMQWGSGILLMLVLAVRPLYAQAVEQVCSQHITNGLNTLIRQCAEQPTFSACYGHPLAEGEGFDNTGDMIALEALESVTLQPFDLETGAWGIVRLLPRYNTYDLPVAVWALGAVTLENTGDPRADVVGQPFEIRTLQGANVRALPAADAPLIGVAYTGDAVRVVGRLADGVWARVDVGDGVFGWINTSALGNVDLAALAEVAPDDAAIYGSGQSFTLTTITAPPNECRFVPPDGVLIQTPAAAEGLRLRVNAVELELDALSTVFLRAMDGAILRVEVLEGSVSVIGEPPIEVLAGTGLTLREGESAVPAAYDYNLLARLPLANLPRTTFAALDFETLLTPPVTDPLGGLTSESVCAVAAVLAAVNLRDLPNPNGRVRHVMQVGQSAAPDGRAIGTDGLVWWRLAENVWVSSNAVAAAGGCGLLPMLPPR